MNALLIIDVFLALGADPIIYQALGALLMSIVAIPNINLKGIMK